MNDTKNFTDLQPGDLVRLKDDFGGYGGKFAGKTVEILSGNDYREHEEDLVIYDVALRARGGVVWSGVPVDSREIAEKAEGWCAHQPCAEAVFNENEPCDYHRKRAQDFNGFLAQLLA